MLVALHSTVTVYPLSHPPVRWVAVLGHASFFCVHSPMQAKLGVLSLGPPLIETGCVCLYYNEGRCKSPWEDERPPTNHS